MIHGNLEKEVCCSGWKWAIIKDKMHLGISQDSKMELLLIAVLMHETSLISSCSQTHCASQTFWQVAHIHISLNNSMIHSQIPNSTNKWQLTWECSFLFPLKSKRKLLKTQLRTTERGMHCIVRDLSLVLPLLGGGSHFILPVFPFLISKIK
jgi:hypothetical protein